MGHTRLGTIPKTEKWAKVVAYMGGEGSFGNEGLVSDDVAEISSLAIDAAVAGLAKAIKDPLQIRAFYLLTQVALSSRESDWKEHAKRLNLSFRESDSVLHLTSQLLSMLDDHATSIGYRSDVGEMASGALGEALTQELGGRAETLFGSGVVELQQAIRDLSTKKGFGLLGQAFFSAFLRRYLSFYLSRIMASLVGTTTVPGIGEASRFQRALQLHCDQRAYIVRDFCAQWYSKTEFEHGIDEIKSAGFVAVALKKLQEELRREGAA